MESFTIHLFFRGRHMTAEVHVHDGFSLIWFTDTEILKDFGGLFELRQGTITPQNKRPAAADRKDFDRAILAGLDQVDR